MRKGAGVELLLRGGLGLGGLSGQTETSSLDKIYRYILSLFSNAKCLEIISQGLVSFYNFT